MNIKKKINRFLGIFFLFSIFISISSAPAFAVKPSFSPTSTHPPKGVVVGAKLKEYHQPSKRHCNIDVPSQYTSIQAGIDAAVNGDTVCVGEGIYNEDVLINKSVRLSGKGANKTIINGQGSTWPGAVYITAKNVVFEGFLINGVGTNSTVQLDVKDSPYDSTLQYNWMKAGNGGMTLQLDGFQNTLVRNNFLEGNNSPYVARESGGSSGQVDFLNNTFMGTVNPNDRSDTGITLDAGLPDGLIQRNVFNTTGTQILLIAPNGTSFINENNFNSSVIRKVGNGWPTTVNAENNWWGDLDPSDNIQGDVDYIPFALKPFPEN